MRQGPCWVAALVAALANATNVAAQTIRIRTIEAETGRVAGGAIVALLDSNGTRLAQGLTSDLGWLTLHAPRPGTYHLRADRIGYPGVSSRPFQALDSVTVTLEMPAERQVLADLTVTGSSQCGRRDDNVQTGMLWDEIRKALAASQITSSTGSIELAVRRFRRYRSLSGRLLSDSTTGQFTTRVSPFVSVQPSALRDGGYIRKTGGEYSFLGPDAGLLLSEEFLEDHCFRLARPADKQNGLVGLGFEPVSGVQLPDIKGTLWVDRATAELRSLDFEYVNVPAPVRVRGLGGRVVFERRPRGDWIVGDWYIRMPDRAAVEQRVSGRRPPVAHDTIVGFVDEGGIARPVGDASVGLTEAVPAARQVATTTFELRGRVVSTDGKPLEGALVAVSGLDSVLTAGAGGAFRVRELPEGRVRLRVRAIGYTPTAIDLAMDGGHRVVDTTIRLAPVAQRLDPIVVTEREDPFKLGKMEGFERRRVQGFGRFLTLDELQDPLHPTLEQQLRRFGRIQLLKVGCLPGYALARFSQPAPPNSLASCGKGLIDACLMTVYMDGALYYSPDRPGPPLDVNDIDLTTLQGLELYRSEAEMPPEYNATGSACGVLVLWTRSGR